MDRISICNSFYFFCNCRIFGTSLYRNMQTNTDAHNQSHIICTIQVWEIVILGFFIFIFWKRFYLFNLFDSSWKKKVGTVMSESDICILKGTRKWNRDTQFREKINEYRFGKRLHEKSEFFLGNQCIVSCLIYFSFLLQIHHFFLHTHLQLLFSLHTNATFFSKLSTKFIRFVIGLFFWFSHTIWKPKFMCRFLFVQIF
jgi:hypothetical protein